MDMLKRTSNFSQDDVDLLISLVKKYESIIANKRTDATTWKEKQQTWEQITKEFNMESVNKSTRTAKCLKMKYENLKKTSKRKFAHEKLETFKTGGGTCSPVQITPTDLAIKDILTVAVTGLPCYYDSDHLEPQQNLYEEVVTDNCISDMHPYARQPTCTAVSNIDTDQDGIVAVSCEKRSTDWSSWSPHDLKQQVSHPLQSKKNTENKENLLPKMRRKTELTADCRMKINILSDAKLELIKLQIENAKQESTIKQEEHHLKLEQMKELHSLKVLQMKLEISRLKGLTPCEVDL